MINTNEKRTDEKGVNPIDWLERHGDYLYGYALFRLRDEAAAEDVLQETLLAAIKSYKNFSGDSSERTWLTGILKHKIVDHYRSCSRQVGIDSNTAAEIFAQNDDCFFDESGRWREKDMFSVWQDNPENLLEQKEFHKILERCLDKLPKKLAAVFILREMEGLDTKEICEALSISQSNLWVMLHRARMQLRREISIRMFNNEKMIVEIPVASSLMAA